MPPATQPPCRLASSNQASKSTRTSAGSSSKGAAAGVTGARERDELDSLIDALDDLELSYPETTEERAKELQTLRRILTK